MQPKEVYKTKAFTCMAYDTHMVVCGNKAAKRAGSKARRRIEERKMNDQLKDAQ
jgi:hypothetical protein